jgi:DNA end-binding protein Ku
VIAKALGLKGAAVCTSRRARLIAYSSLHFDADHAHVWIEVSDLGFRWNKKRSDRVVSDIAVDIRMAPRAFWKGYLKLSLVTCPVAMMPATSENEKVRFHIQNRKTGDRVVTRDVDAVSGKPVEEDDEVRGYERGEDDYVVLKDEELEAVGLESTRTIDIDMFVPADSIEWVWYDKPHYLMPDDPVGEEAFSVIRDAMLSTSLVGISRLVIYRRERAVMLEPRDKGIVLWTLRYGDEVRSAEEYFRHIADTKPDSKMINLSRHLLKSAQSRGIRIWSPIRCKPVSSTPSRRRRKARNIRPERRRKTRRCPAMSSTSWTHSARAFHRCQRRPDANEGSIPVWIGPQVPLCGSADALADCVNGIRNTQLMRS